ncbi:MAG: zinc ribbon domain-containing protein [Polyangiaceae bacterium]
MNGPTASNCPHCGAPLSPPVSGLWNCAYCGHSGAVPTVPAVVRQPIAARRNANGAGPGCALALGLLVAIGGAALAAAILGNGAFLSVKHTTEISAGTKSRDGKANPAHADFIWDDVGGPPIVTMIDGKEAVVGRGRTVRDGNRLWGIVTDSATLSERYRLGPFGTYGEGYLSTHFAVTNGLVLATDFHSNLHFYELSTGKETATLQLSDRVECLSVVGDGRVRIEQVDGKSLFVDVATRTTTAAPQRRARGDNLCKRRSVERLARPASEAPAVDGFAALRVFVDGDEAIAAGKKSPGTPIPWVVGFEPGSKRVRFRQLLPNVDPNTVDASSELAGALASHRFVSVYPVGSESHRLTAFDARNGARLWDVELRGIFAVNRIEDIVLSESFVYAVRTSSLDVLDARTGRLIGAIGQDTYDK